MSALHRILLADDDPDIHGLLVAALSEVDREIESAHDGLEALQRIEATPFDLVITDVNMPGLDGLTLLERIQKVRPGTKVAVMTVANTPETIVHAIRERAFTYFTKPFTIQSAIDLVDSALRSQAEPDDIEVLSARSNWLALRLRCKMETGDRILQFLQAMGPDLPEEEQREIAMAFREILLNAIEHGGGADPNNRVVVTFVRAQRALLYYVRDPGSGFSFDNLTHAAVSNPAESPIEHIKVREELGLRPGGYGLLMTRNLVDEMIYNEAGNEVLLIKYLK